MRVLAQPCSASSRERGWSAYGRVHSDVRNRHGKRTAEKLARTYFNGGTKDKASQVDWEMQSFLWDDGGTE